MKILVIDNIDSFVYNLVQYVGALNVEVTVVENTISYSKLKKLILKEKFDGIIISPGPKRPEDAGVSVSVIKDFGDKIPILGVCLGHQCIGVAYGGKIRNAKTLMHGKVSRIKHNNAGVFKGLPNPLEATRYHSLVVDNRRLPEELEVSAESLDDREIMGLKHRRYRVFGVQFHPESILTVEGLKLIKNFLSTVDGQKNRN